MSRASLALGLVCEGCETCRGIVPAYDDIASLYFEGGQWVIHHALSADPLETHSMIESEALPLSEETIIRVLNAIVSHAA